MDQGRLGFRNLNICVNNIKLINKSKYMLKILLNF